MRVPGLDPRIDPRIQGQASARLSKAVRRRRLARTATAGAAHPGKHCAPAGEPPTIACLIIFLPDREALRGSWMRRGERIDFAPNSLLWRSIPCVREKIPCGLA